MPSPQRVSSLIVLLGMSLITPTVLLGSVADSLMSQMSSQGKSDAILELPSVMSSVLSSPKMATLSGAKRTSMMTVLLKQFSAVSQAPFMSVIKNFGFADQVQPFWVANKLSITNASLPLILAMMKIPGQFALREPQKVNLIAGDFSEALNISMRNGTPEWGVEKIEAPAVWETTKGENVIVAGIDTGVLKNHETLKDNFQPGGWFDAMKRKAEPYDDHGHGTHTMGTIVGQNGIGVAPGATWIACKGLGAKGGTEKHLIDCAQFVLNFKPTPKVVCNSWGGGQGKPFYNQEIESWHQAGIVPVFAIGNTGPNCSSANSPGDQPRVISVGATDAQDKIARFSSRGYTIGTKTFKPEVCAPGVAIRSASKDGEESYSTLQGTSMAAPHVTGAIALMLSAYPGLTFDEILEKLKKTAVRSSVKSSETLCGKDKGNWPNNHFGFGRINVKEVMALIYSETGVIRRNNSITYQLPNLLPTPLPTVLPTPLPTVLPTPLPTVLPTPLPTVLPTPLPTVLPTPLPTMLPTPLPAVLPTPLPTVLPTPLPTVLPNPLPTQLPDVTE